MDERRERGAVFLEVIYCTIPMLILILGIAQLALMVTARLMTEYAVGAAARTSLTALSDGARPRPTQAPEPPQEATLRFGSGELGSADYAESTRFRRVHEAASYVLAGLAPADGFSAPSANSVTEALDEPARRSSIEEIDAMSPATSLVRAVLDLQPRLKYSREATSVLFIDSAGMLTSQVGADTTVRVTHLYRCRIPIVRRLACRPFVELPAQRVAELRANPFNHRLRSDATLGYYFVASAESSVWLQESP